MKIKLKIKEKLIVFSFSVMGLLTCLSSSALASQPCSSYWFPNDLKNWNVSADKDAKFNKGTIPLANRFFSDKINPNASVKPKIMAISIMNPSTSGSPSQGSNKFDTYTFSYWQYVDSLIYWGGSAGEGLIVPPSADVIDSSHKNGVPVLGTVFLPPAAYGGRSEWVHDLLQKDSNGNFPVADKLLEVANYYGFDGWFINQETNTSSSNDANLMQQFLKYLQAKKSPNMQIVWYDSMDKYGSVNWQNALNSSNKVFFGDSNNILSNSMFLNFNWSRSGLNSSANLATQMGRSPYDLYAGIDVQANGYDTYVNWTSLFPSNKGDNAYTSLGLYCPNSTFTESQNVNDYMARDNRFWIGANGDPRNTTTSSSWKGLANYVVEKSPINKLPFSTSFNMGNGNFFAINGKVVKNSTWNNRSLQDIMPTWRWVIDNNSNTLKPSIGFNSAYYGGTSLNVSGDLKANGSSLLKLYKTNLTIESNTKLNLTYKVNTDNSNLKVALTFDGDSKTYFIDTLKDSSSDWTTNEASLQQFSGKKLTSISLYFSSSNDINGYNANIGQLILKNSDSSESLSAVSNLKIEEQTLREDTYTDARLSWNKSNIDVQQYEIYRVNPNGAKEFLGATPNNCYYVQEFKRLPNENISKLEVVAVDKNYNHSSPTSIDVTWPAYPKPVANFTSDKTLVAPGESVTFTSTSSDVTESVKWYFEGASIDSSTEFSPTVKYNTEGSFKVSLIAKNSSGENEIIKTNYITVSKAAIGGLKNLSLNKTATADSYVNSNENPSLAVDNSDSTKWCAVGDNSHWLKVDLGSNFSISNFLIKHAEAGGESSSFNTKAFRIQLSEDNVNWSDVVTVTNNSSKISTHSIPVTNARYVKLIVDKATQGGDYAARIYDFEVLGVENLN